MKKDKPRCEVISKTEKDIDEGLVCYRKAGIGVSATLIILSSGMLAWVYGARFLLSPKAEPFFYSSLVVLATAIFSALLMQFFDYKGYFNQARMLITQSSHHNKADHYFKLADLALRVALALFIVGSILSVIFKMLDSKYSG